MQKKFGGYENKLQLYSAPNENFFFILILNLPSVKIGGFFVSSVGAFSFSQLAGLYWYLRSNPPAWQLYIINYTLYIKRKQASSHLHEESLS